jgi:DNA-binding CsgD family transcriptional regulator
VLDGYALWLAAQAAHDLGDPAAGTLAEEALAVATEAEYPIGMALALTTLGQGELQRGELAAARTLLERAVAMHGAAAFLGRLWSLVTLAWVATLQADLDRARTCLAEALAIGHDALGGRSRLVMPLEGFAQLAAAVGQPVRALRLAGAAAALRATHAAPPTPMEHTQLEHWLLRARATLGQLEAEMAWVSGQRLGPAQAVAEARALELGPAAAEPAPARSSRDSLTAREREVALLIGEGLGTRQIAERLVIAEGTARVHVERILAKLGLHSRAQLAAWAVRQALAPATSPDRLTPTLVESGRSRDRNQPEVGSRC